MAQAPEYSANEGTPDALPKGEATAMNEMVQDVDLEVEDPVAFPEEDLAGSDEVPPMEGDLTGMDDLVFGAETDRPNEPVTAGATFGPGAYGVAADGRTPEQRLADYALSAINDPTMSSRSKAIMARIIRGD